MRREQFVIGNYYHIYNRGSRKGDIFFDEKDMWRFLQALYFFNDVNSSAHIFRQLSELGLPERRSGRPPKSVFDFGWPRKWPKQNSLVRILCYCLMPNHYHLILEEIREKGISMFMHKLNTGFTNFSNAKYGTSGSLFQGPFRAILILDERYLEYLSVYIQVMNPLELFNQSITKENKKEAMRFVENYIFCSYPDFIGLRNSKIIEKGILGKLFPTPEEYKKFAEDSVLTKDIPDILGKDLILE